MRSYKKEKENSKVFKFLSETAFNQVWIDFASKVTEGKKIHVLQKIVYRSSIYKKSI